MAGHFGLLGVAWIWLNLASTRLLAGFWLDFGFHFLGSCLDLARLPLTMASCSLWLGLRLTDACMILYLLVTSALLALSRRPASSSPGSRPLHGRVPDWVESHVHS